MEAPFAGMNSRYFTTNGETELSTVEIRGDVALRRVGTSKVSNQNAPKKRRRLHIGGLTPVMNTQLSSASPSPRDT
jgi:hypothetical protein